MTWPFLFSCSDHSIYGNMLPRKQNCAAVIAMVACALFSVELRGRRGEKLGLQYFLG